MPWVVTFIFSWILFFIFIDFKSLRVNTAGGLISVLLATLVDWGGGQLNLYHFHDVIISWAGCSIFYKWGPVFTMGTLFVQLVPLDKWLQMVHVLVFSLSYIAMEIMIVYSGAACYEHWHWLASFFINLIVFSTLTWITLLFIRKSIISVNKN